MLALSFLTLVGVALVVGRAEQQGYRLREVMAQCGVIGHFRRQSAETEGKTLIA